MKILSSQEIKSLDDKKSIEDKKHQKELNHAVNPPKPRRTRMSVPRQREQKSSMDPARLAKILGNAKKMSPTQDFLPQNDYREYKESLKRSAIGLVSSMEGEHKEIIQDKLANSNDIPKILTNQLLDLDLIQNEWVILALTIGGKFLESRAGV